MEARQPTNLMSQSSNMEAKTLDLQNSLNEQLCHQWRTWGSQRLCGTSKFPQQMFTTQHMMQAGSNLILSGISDTAVWRAGSAGLCVLKHGEGHRPHLLRTPSMWLLIKGYKQARNKWSSSIWSIWQVFFPGGRWSDTFTTGTHLFWPCLLTRRHLTEWIWHVATKDNRQQKPEDACSWRAKHNTKVINYTGKCVQHVYTVIVCLKIMKSNEHNLLSIWTHLFFPKALFNVPGMRQKVSPH